MDALICIDDLECKKGLQLLSEETGRRVLIERYGCDSALIERLSTLFGISGLCNILGAIKTAKHYGLGRGDVIATVATDSLDRYYSVMDSMRECYGTLDEAAAVGRIEGVFHSVGTDWVQPATKDARARWHNLKYYTWVEQQGKSVEELDAQKSVGWWVEHQGLVGEIDARLIAHR
jgi:hypothetical protein